MLHLKQRFVQRERYAGWPIVWMLGPTQLLTWGIVYYTFSVMLLPMQQEMGWTSAEVAGALSLAVLVSGVTGVPIGRWMDRYGPRRMMIAGVIAASLLVLAWSRVETLPALYLVWIGLGALMPAILYEPAFWLVARWFSGDWLHRRGRALTIVTFFGGLAGTALIPLSSALQRTYDWRTALLMLAALLPVCTVIPYLLLLRPPAMHVSASHTKIHASLPLRDRAFWLITISMALTGLAWSAMSVHLITYALSRGQSAAFVALAAGAIGVMQVVGRLVFVPLSDRVPHKHIASVLCVIQSLAVICLIALPDGVGLIGYAIAFGIGHGAMTPIRATLVADTFGVHSYGAINGAVSFAGTLARAAGPVALGVAVAMLGSYEPAFWVLMTASLIAAGLLLRLPETHVHVQR